MSVHRAVYRLLAGILDEHGRGRGEILDEEERQWSG
jgi:hypothetical protein